MFYSCRFESFNVRHNNLEIGCYNFEVKLDLPRGWTGKSFDKHIKKGGEVLISFKKTENGATNRFDIVARPGRYLPQFRMYCIKKFGPVLPDLLENSFRIEDLGYCEGDWRNTKDLNEILEPLAKSGSYIHKINITDGFNSKLERIIIFQRINPPPKKDNHNIDWNHNERISGVFEQIDTPDEKTEYKETSCDQIAGVFDPINK